MSQMNQRTRTTPNSNLRTLRKYPARNTRNNPTFINVNSQRLRSYPLKYRRNNPTFNPKNLNGNKYKYPMNNSFSVTNNPSYNNNSNTNSNNNFSPPNPFSESRTRTNPTYNKNPPKRNPANASGSGVSQYVKNRNANNQRLLNMLKNNNKTNVNTMVGRHVVTSNNLNKYSNIRTINGNKLYYKYQTDGTPRPILIFIKASMDSINKTNLNLLSKVLVNKMPLLGGKVSFDNRSKSYEFSDKGPFGTGYYHMGYFKKGRGGASASGSYSRASGSNSRASGSNSNNSNSNNSNTNPFRQRNNRTPRPSGSLNPFQQRNNRTPRPSGSLNPFQQRNNRTPRPASSLNPFQQRNNRTPRPTGSLNPFRQRLLNAPGGRNNSTPRPASSLVPFQQRNNRTPRPYGNNVRRRVPEPLQILNTAKNLNYSNLIKMLNKQKSSNGKKMINMNNKAFNNYSTTSKKFRAQNIQRVLNLLKKNNQGTRQQKIVLHPNNNINE